MHVHGHICCAHWPGWSAVRHLCWGKWQNSLNRLTQCAANKQHRSSVELLRWTNGFIALLNTFWKWYTWKANMEKKFCFKKWHKTKKMLGVLRLQAVPREQISVSVHSPLARRRTHCVPGSPAPSIHPPTSGCGWLAREETAGGREDGEVKLKIYSPPDTLCSCR